MQQFFYLGCLDIFLDQKFSYFFTFFRIFRFEHTKLTYFFLDYNLIDVSSLTKVFYNQNLNYLSELQYHNIHLSANLKILAFAAYFASMPVILTLDFLIVQCLSSKLIGYKWFNENVAQSYFFSGPLMLFTVMCFPVIINVVLEIKFININNEFQMYSLAVCAALSLILVLYLASLWTVIITHYKHKNHPLVL